MSDDIVNSWSYEENTTCWVHDGDVERSAVDIVALAEQTAAYAAEVSSAIAGLKENISDAQSIAAGSTQARTFADRFADIVNVKDFGAKGDGVTDDADAVQAALDHGASLGRTVFFPSGTYLITEALSVTGNTHALSILADDASIFLDAATA